MEEINSDHEETSPFVRDMEYLVGTLGGGFALGFGIDHLCKRVSFGEECDRNISYTCRTATQFKSREDLGDLEIQLRYFSEKYNDCIPEVSFARLEEIKEMYRPGDAGHHFNGFRKFQALANDVDEQRAKFRWH